MLAIEGYYDGATIRLPETFTAKRNQRVIVTLLDEFVRPKTVTKKTSVRGVLARYADPKLQEKEKGAWGCAMVEKYGHL